MNSSNYLGIWMDHSIAYVMEFENHTIVTNRVVSNCKNSGMGKDLSPKASLMLCDESKPDSAYYQELSDVIIDHDNVILFGPENSKNELMNLLLYNHLFDKINLAVKPADQMDEVQRHIFIRDNFGNPGTNPKNNLSRLFSFI